MRNPEQWGTLAKRFSRKPQRKLLALDGGGIRGILTLSFLKRIEDIVGEPLHEYFDYIAGTSTGAIIAAGLAYGMSVDEVIKFYRTSGPEMFQRTNLLARLRSLYENGALEKKLKKTFGEHTDLRLDGVERPGKGDKKDKGKLKTLLLVVTRNVTTDSPWPISTNPDACYNDPTRSDSNLNMRLWQIVRASTAAPIYFPPEVIECEPGNPKKTFVFVDGGVTPYNNPAFLLYRFATDPAFNLEWERGEDKMLLISVGTGAAATLGATADHAETNLLANFYGVPSALMYGSLVDQDINCRTIGRCVHGDEIDRELLDMIPRSGAACGRYSVRRKRPILPLTVPLHRQFLYARYNVDLGRRNLDDLGFKKVDPAAVQRLDNVTPENMETLFKIGAASAKQIKKDHFGPFL